MPPANISFVELAEESVDGLKRYLEGKFLTIIDASISDIQQRKAVKDLTREAVWSQEYFTKSITNLVQGKSPYEGNIGNQSTPVNS